MATSTPQTQTPRRSREADKVSGSFKKQEEIGRGSFATVYKAIHTDSAGSETLVAIKSVNTGKLNKKLRDNLTSEISILKSLHHPHIAALIDCKETNAHIHLIMEYVALGDLSQFIKRREQVKDTPYVGNMMIKYPNPRVGGLHEVVVRHFLQQLASALQFLRARNLIHRDVKPQNLLLNPSPEYFLKVKPSPMPYQTTTDSLEPICGIRSLPMLKIADFGFARSLPSTSLAETLCGSPLYMAPEILRYEKYDAKADLWSVGTVLYEMVTSKPPFRAANHVELLRKIEKTNDVIKFGEEIEVSEEMKKLIRSLLRRDPKERVSFPDFFASEIITGSIPGLAPEDLPEPIPSENKQDRSSRRASRTDPTDLSRPGKIPEPESPYADAQRTFSEDIPHPRRSSITSQPRLSGTNVQTPSSPAHASPLRKYSGDTPTSPTAARPALIPHATAPARQELILRNPPPASAAMARQASGGQPRPPSLLRQQVQDHNMGARPQSAEDRESERVAQEIAFERDYVVVEKRAVEVNALADELDHNPRLAKAAPAGQIPQAGPMVRRATTQGLPTSTTGAQTTASRAVQIAQGRRPDPLHQRQSSYERRYAPSPTSAASAISRALNMASGRLFGGGLSPPINFGRSGRSPPMGYNPFPAYPGAQSSLVVIGDHKPGPVDDDTRYVQMVEELATRSDVVYGFAEVKYKQLTPAIPSPSRPGLDVRQPSNDQGSDPVGDDLTIEALVTVSEEALVLYVKALSLLQKAMDTAARWWELKKRESDNATPSPGRLSNNGGPAGQRMNNVVQWTRNRFNEVLEKTDLVRLRLLDSQRRLPEDHPSHPGNTSAGAGSSTGSNSSDHVVVSPGVTAEKLMYDRALEMSRSAAINELTGEDLPGCEISYVTAIRMLEAVLEIDEEGPITKGGKALAEDQQPINGLEAEDRKAVTTLVRHIRDRLSSLQRKLQVIQKRASAPAIGSPVRASPPIGHRPSNPSMGLTPPQQ